MLNPSQEKVVKHIGKPLLCIAGAGSGKTRTIAYKVAYLIKDLGIDPENLLVVTFSNKAGQEIKERVRAVTGTVLPWSGTFHSVAVKLLKTYGVKKGFCEPFSLLDRGDADKVLQEILQGRNLGRDQLDKLRKYISDRWEDMMDPYDELMESLMEDYENFLRKNALMDFSYLMKRTVEFLEHFPHVKDHFFYVLVDEFQDTNTVQYYILKGVSRENVCVVGDPNQCIYEWRYARPDNILRFIEDFNPDVVKLEINYRSGGYIVQVANAVVASSEVAWKDLVPVLVSAKGEGSKPVVRRFEREDEEASWIANKIKELSLIYPLSRIAILVRTSYVTEAIERALFSARIPYKVVGTLRFFERAEVKDVLSPFIILANKSNSVAFRRFLQAFSQNLGDKSWEKIQAFYKGDWIEASQMALKHLRPSAAQSLHHLIVLLRILQKNIEDYPTALENFLDAVGYMEDLSEERRKNVQELLLYLKARKREGYSWEDVVEEVTLLSGEEEEQDAVRIMTIHASKGLEFDVVFLPRLEEGILPHEKSIEEDRLEEERRLFYVGITRAKELLFMSYTREKSKPSRFLSCIPKNLLDLSAFVKKEKGQLTWRAGQKVQHRVFGIGHVVRVEGPKVIVRFKDGEKSIYSAFLEPVE